LSSPGFDLRRCPPHRAWLPLQPSRLRRPHSPTGLGSVELPHPRSLTPTGSGLFTLTAMTSEPTTQGFTHSLLVSSRPTSATCRSCSLGLVVSSWLVLGYPTTVLGWIGQLSIDRVPSLFQGLFQASQDEWHVLHLAVTWLHFLVSAVLGCLGAVSWRVVPLPCPSSAAGVVCQH